MTLGNLVGIPTPTPIKLPVSGNPPVSPLPVTEEGARYALLQRLMPALQHQVMGNFQSLDMIAVMMERHLQPATPDLSSMRGDCALLGSVSQAAVQSVVNLMAWVRPQLDSGLAFDAGVAECAKVLGAELQFRGFVVVNEVVQVDALAVAMVSGRAVRSVLSAALIFLSDQSPVPASLVMRANALPARIELSIDLIPNGQPAGNAATGSYRLLDWQDVEALAAAESAELVRSNTGIQLSFLRLAVSLG